MILPNELVAATKNALQRFRDDSADIQRFNPQTVADEVASMGLPCHLSASSLPTQTGKDAAGQTDATYTIYFDDAVELRAGDKITVRHKGQTVVGVAGLPHRGTFSIFAKLESVVIS